MSKRKPGEIAQKTITRRTWLEWVGAGAAVVSLQSLLAKCTPDSPGDSADAGGGPDGGADATPPPGIDAATNPLCDDGKIDEFPFQPGDTLDEVFRNWGERTVDRHRYDFVRVWLFGVYCWRREWRRLLGCCRWSQ